MELEVLNKYEKGQICVLADKKLIRHPEWLASTKLHDYPVMWIEVSEQDKSLETVSKIWDFLFEHGITRRGLLICIGGGILTDLGGFAAATYKRGIDYINIPTTLLAMIDASTGGKTGINYRGLKNSIGTFAPPVTVLIDPTWLSTLPTEQFLSGFGEMLKTGLLDEQLWSQLLQYDLEMMPTKGLNELIEQCLAIKARIVQEDPQETGTRKVLNLGHTFGHAIEAISFQQTAIHHGYAVVYGLIAELYLSVVKLGCNKEPLQQLTQIMLHDYGKPQCKCSDVQTLVKLMQQDKKNEHAGQINCTLLQAVGKPVINQEITEQEAVEAWEYLFSL